MQEKRLLRHGFEAYLAHVEDVKKATSKIKYIVVVNEFLDIS